jgi:hypothetical protein
MSDEEKLGRLQSEFKETINKVFTASEHERAIHKAKVKNIKKKYKMAEQNINRTGVRLSTVLVIQALRETGDGVPTSDAAERSIRKTYNESDLPSESFDEYVAVVAEVLELPDPLSWVDSSESHIWDEPIDPSPRDPPESDDIDVPTDEILDDL